MRKKSISLIIIPLIISLAITLAAVGLYKNMNLSDTCNRLIQNAAYVLMLLTTFSFMKICKKSFREFGLFKEHLFKQIIIGIIISGVFLLLAALSGWRPYLKENLLYLALSQVLVAFSEELLFRGYVITMLKDVVNTANKAMVVSAIIFGLWHYPIGQSIGQVITTFLLGLIFGALRTIFYNTDDEIGILSFVIAHWVLNVIL